MDDKNLKEELFKEIKRRGLLEQEEEDDTDDSTDNTEDTDEGDGKLYKLSSKTIKILTDRIKDEYTAHYFYRAATNWCRDKNYKKAAEFFSNEADDELTHAKKIQEYMTDFNIIPQIPQAPIDHKFDGLIEIVHGAYKMELGLMKSYNKDSQELFSEDITTFDFLTEFREIQKGAVVEYNDLINGSELVDTKDKFQVLYFEQTYFQ
jgi:ferritin